jgi:HD-GYP domain-containing protein (c-di-GMP phosphodiesterase class II)
MLRSKRIEDYIEASIDDFTPGVALPVDVHLYFTSNRHILIWRKQGEVLTQDFVDKFASRGMKQVWLHREDEELWRKYLAEQKASRAPAPAPVHEAAAPVMEYGSLSAAQPTESLTEEGRHINGMLSSSEYNDRQRTALVARAARELLAETARHHEEPQAGEAKGHARDAVRDILDAVLESATQDVRKAINEIWSMGAISPGFDHAIQVASFSVLFALSFGRISKDLIADIALAALLHDVGLTQLPAQVVQKPWNEQQGRMRQQYARHVDEGLRLLDELAPEALPRVRTLIQQHHEKFDGTGYPLQLHGFQINDIAQLISMADMIVSMAEGHWDGKKRPLMATFDHLEVLERQHGKGGHFNPEVFGAVLRWIRNPGTLSSKLKASDIVRSTAREVLKRA